MSLLCGAVFHQQTMLAVDFRYRALGKLRRSSSVQIIHPDSISFHVLARDCIIRHHVKTLNADLVGVFAGAVEAVLSSFAVMLCQYTASMIEHCILAAMHLIVQWDLSTIPFPNGKWAHQNCTCTPHVRANCPQNTMPVLVSSSVSGPPFTKYPFMVLDEIS